MRNSALLRATVVITISLLLAVSGALPAGAQQAGSQTPQPPQRPGSEPQKQDPKTRKRDQRQGAVAEEQTPASDEGSLKVDTDLVQLDVTVVDSNNNPAYDLTKGNFTVYEDRIKQELENVSREEVPVSLGLVIDTSGSMRSRLQTVSDAARSLIQQMKNEDEAMVASFKAEAELVQDFTRDKRELEDAIDQLYTSGGTALLDALIATAEYAHQKGSQRRKALIVISDGLEKNSSVKEREVMEAIKEFEVQVYLVGFIDEDEDRSSLFGKSPAKKAKELLTRLSEDSGGRAFFPKDVSEMPLIAEQIAKDLRTQYVISYYPTSHEKDGKFHAVRVTVETKDKRKLIPRTRRGYYARKPGQPIQSDEKKVLGKS